MGVCPPLARGAGEHLEPLAPAGSRWHPPPLPKHGAGQCDGPAPAVFVFSFARPAARAKLKTKTAKLAGAGRAHCFLSGVTRARLPASCPVTTAPPSGVNATQYVTVRGVFSPLSCTVSAGL